MEIAPIKTSFQRANTLCINTHASSFAHNAFHSRGVRHVAAVMFCLKLNIAVAGLALTPPRSLTDWRSLWEKSHKRRKFYFGAAQSVGFVQNPGTRWEASKDGEKAG